MTAVTFYLNNKGTLTDEQKNNLAEKLAISITLNTLEVNTIVIDNDVYSLNKIRQRLKRSGIRLLKDPYTNEDNPI